MAFLGCRQPRHIVGTRHDHRHRPHIRPLLHLFDLGPCIGARQNPNRDVRLREKHGKASVLRRQRLG